MEAAATPGRSEAALRGGLHTLSCVTGTNRRGCRSTEPARRRDALSHPPCPSATRGRRAVLTQPARRRKPLGAGLQTTPPAPIGSFETGGSARRRTAAAAVGHRNAGTHRLSPSGPAGTRDFAPGLVSDFPVGWPFSSPGVSRPRCCSAAGPPAPSPIILESGMKFRWATERWDPQELCHWLAEAAAFCDWFLELSPRRKTRLPTPARGATRVSWAAGGARGGAAATCPSVRSAGWPGHPPPHQCSAGESHSIPHQRPGKEVVKSLVRLILTVTLLPCPVVGTAGSSLFVLCRLGSPRLNGIREH